MLFHYIVRYRIYMMCQPWSLVGYHWGKAAQWGTLVLSWSGAVQHNFHSNTFYELFQLNRINNCKYYAYNISKRYSLKLYIFLDINLRKQWVQMNCSELPRILENDATKMIGIHLKLLRAIVCSSEVALDSTNRRNKTKWVRS